MKKKMKLKKKTNRVDNAELRKRLLDESVCVCERKKELGGEKLSKGEKRTRTESEMF